MTQAKTPMLPYSKMELSKKFYINQEISKEQIVYIPLTLKNSWVVLPQSGLFSSLKLPNPVEQRILMFLSFIGCSAVRNMFWNAEFLQENTPFSINSYWVSERRSIFLFKNICTNLSKCHKLYFDDIHCPLKDDRV